MRRLESLPGMAILDSALQMPRIGRYSYLGIDPVEVFSITRPKSDPLARIAESLTENRDFQIHPNRPPFQGGWMGYLGYEFGRCYERVPAARHNEFDLPLAMLGLYDLVIAWDHQSPKQGWIFSSGLSKSDTQTTSDARGVDGESADLSSEAPTLEAREKRKSERLAWLLRHLQSSNQESSAAAAASFQQTSFQAMAHGLTAPQFETRLGGGWLGSFDSDGFRKAVDQAREFIYAGDIFQVNLAQRLMKPSTVDSPTLYRHLRNVNAAPFAGYFDGGAFQIISASPERFLQVHDRIVETRPIKGTRRRAEKSNSTHVDDLADQSTAKELLASAKDRAENTMIVDLLRNDLSRVCDPSSIRVPQWCDIEKYPYLIHMVSSITGRLLESASITDLIRATFPGGSITGAPKVRAMEIIAEIEPTTRGPYCGSMGYIGLNGSMDLNILIRTITASRGWWQLQVGGGIVADSQSDMEEEETWTKAAGLVKAIAACEVRK
jgi:para-aminobenzoate synthetase component I